MAGFADSPLALTPFGSGTPATGTAPPDEPPKEAPFIDPRSRDYQLAADGSYKRMPRTRHRMLMTVLTSRGSIAPLPDFGVSAPAKISQDYPRRMRAEIQRATKYLVDDGSIDLIDVKTETAGGRVIVTIFYFDRVSGETDQLIV